MVDLDGASHSHGAKPAVTGVTEPVWLLNSVSDVRLCRCADFAGPLLYQLACYGKLVQPCILKHFLHGVSEAEHVLGGDLDAGDV
eukprot:4413556-Amphidinium_carterae.2